MYIEYTIRRNKPGAVGSIPSAARARSSVPAADRSERLISLPELASYHGLGTRSGLWGRDGRTALPGAWRSDLRVSGEPSSLHTRRCHRGSSRDDGAICGVRKRLNRESPRRHGVTSCNRVSALIPGVTRRQNPNPRSAHRSVKAVCNIACFNPFVSEARFGVSDGRQPCVGSCGGS